MVEAAKIDLSDALGYVGNKPEILSFRMLFIGLK